MLSFYPHTKILGPTRKMLLPMGVEQPHLIHTAGFVSDHKRLHKPHAPRSSPPQANRNPAENFSLPLSASPPMATMNSSALACSYALSGASDPRWKLTPAPSAAPPTASSTPKLPAIRAQQARPAVSKDAKGSEGRRAALLGVAATLFAATAANSSPANAGIIDEYLERSKANKELNDKKRSATTGANFARAYTVEFGTCKFPENFTGCQDLAKQKKVPFISDDLEIECEGKDKYKCGSNVFWKW